jgi:hypothetical protein
MCLGHALSLHAEAGGKHLAQHHHIGWLAKGYKVRIVMLQIRFAVFPMQIRLHERYSQVIRCTHID